MLNREVEKKIKEHESELDVERKRIDNIISVEDSTDNLETADIRVGADGKTYASAGESVRTQLSNVINQFSKNDTWVDNNKTKIETAYEEITEAREDYFGEGHNDLKNRLNSDFDNIHQRVNESSLLPYEGTNITANNSYYGLVKDEVIKGRTLQNIAIDKDTEYGTSGQGGGLKTERLSGENGSKWTVINNTIQTYRTVRLKKQNMLKASTIYTLFFKITKDDFGLEKEFTLCGINDSYHNNSANRLYRGSYVVGTGTNVIKFTTHSDISTYDGIGFGFPQVNTTITLNGAETIIKM